MRRTIMLGFVASISCSLYAAQEHHDIETTACRALPNGSLQVAGISDVDVANVENAEDEVSRLILFNASSFSEKVLDRYLSLCMASVASSHKLRIDYLECSGTSCEPTGATSLSYSK